MQSKLPRILFFFLIFLILFQLFSKKETTEVNKGDDIIISSKTKFVIGKEVVLDIKNQSSEVLQIPSNCPNNPLSVEKYQNGEWLTQTAVLDDSSVCDEKPELFAEIEPNSKSKISFGLWNKDLFNEGGAVSHYL